MRPVDIGRPGARIVAVVAASGWPQRWAGFARRRLSVDVVVVILGVSWPGSGACHVFDVRNAGLVRKERWGSLVIIMRLAWLAGYSGRYQWPC